MKKLDVNLIKKKLDADFLEISKTIDKDAYERGINNPNNFSKWFEPVKQGVFSSDTDLQIPETLNFVLPFDVFMLLRKEIPTTDSVKQLDQYLKTQMSDNGFKHETYFLKDGTFSNKFDFSDCHITGKKSVGRALQRIHYTSSMLGAGSSAEIVIREFIEPSENTDSIYDGMPLRTEFRVFYDFDTRKVLGVANYWHPDVMTTGLSHPSDIETYNKNRFKIEEEFNSNKEYVISQVDKAMATVDLSGQWSVDIMKNGNDYWLIDMALMKNSALTDKMIPIDENMSVEDYDYLRCDIYVLDFNLSTKGVDFTVIYPATDADEESLLEENVDLETLFYQLSNSYTPRISHFSKDGETLESVLIEKLTGHYKLVLEPTNIKMQTRDFAVKEMNVTFIKDLFTATESTTVSYFATSEEALDFVKQSGKLYIDNTEDLLPF